MLHGSQLPATPDLEHSMLSSDLCRHAHMYGMNTHWHTYMQINDKHLVASWWDILEDKLLDAFPQYLGSIPSAYIVTHSHWIVCYFQVYKIQKFIAGVMVQAYHCSNQAESKGVQILGQPG